MKIKYLGHSCFYLQSENGGSILTDPYTKVGYELPQGIQTDIVCVSHEHFDHNYTQGILARQIIRGAEVKEVLGIKIQGIESFHDAFSGQLRGKNVIYKFLIDGIMFCHLGDLGEPFNEQLCAQIGEIDVLLLPIGGTYTIDALQAKKYAEKIAPKVIIPMHYKPKDGALDIATEAAFLDLFDYANVKRIPDGEYTLSCKNLTEEAHILFMERAKE